MLQAKRRREGEIVERSRWTAVRPGEVLFVLVQRQDRLATRCISTSPSRIFATMSNWSAGLWFDSMPDRAIISCYVIHASGTS